MSNYNQLLQDSQLPPTLAVTPKDINQGAGLKSIYQVSYSQEGSHFNWTPGVGCGSQYKKKEYKISM